MSREGVLGGSDSSSLERLSLVALSSSPKLELLHSKQKLYGVCVCVCHLVNK